VPVLKVFPFVAARSQVAEKMNRKHKIYGADGDTRSAIMYLTPRSRAHEPE